MTRDDVNAICHALRGATAADPATELDSWKVGGKMFACFGNPDATRVAVKTDSAETATMLIDAGAATKAPYFHRSWVLGRLRRGPLRADPSDRCHPIPSSTMPYRNACAMRFNLAF